MATRDDISRAVVHYTTFVGVDLHKTTVTLVAVDRRLDIVAQLKIDTKCVSRIEAFLAELPGPVWLAVEAVGFVEWFIERFTPCVGRIDIADATELHRLRGKRRKTDRNDAADIARRLARGECPLGFIAGPELMALRKRGRHWHRLSRTLSRAKHGMKSILNAANLRGPKIDGAGTQRWLLAHGHLLPPVQREAFADLLDVVQLIERQQERLKIKIIQANRSDAFARTTGLLQSVPGIGPIWSCIIAAEIGPFERFPNADALEFWAGITPDNQESAGRTQSGHITKAGSATLRWAICTAAVCLCRSDAAWAAKRQRLRRKIGKPKANVALGRCLLRTLYAMMRDGTPFQKSVSTNHTARANRARTRKRQARTDTPTRPSPRQQAEAFLAGRRSTTRKGDAKKQ